jgi:hypothetical protein
VHPIRYGCCCICCICGCCICGTAPLVHSWYPCHLCMLYLLCLHLVNTTLLKKRRRTR